MKQYKKLIDVIQYRTYATLKAEASRAYLGMLWWVLEPVLYMTMFYIVFTQIFHRGGEGYINFLLVGLVAWKWFSSSVMQGCMSISSNFSLIQQVPVSKVIFPVVVVFVNSFKFIIVFSILMAGLFIFTDVASLMWLYIPLVVLVQAMLVIGAATFVAAIIPFFPDVKQIVDNVITLMFFMSGIFFDMDALSAKMQAYLSVNPMLLVIHNYRLIILQGVEPDWHEIAAVSILSLSLIMLSLWIIIKNNKIYPKLYV